MLPSLYITQCLLIFRHTHKSKAFERNFLPTCIPSPGLCLKGCLWDSRLKTDAFVLLCLSVAFLQEAMRLKPWVLPELSGGFLCCMRAEVCVAGEKKMLGLSQSLFFLEKHDLMEPQLASNLLEQRVILNFLPFWLHPRGAGIRAFATSWYLYGPELHWVLRVLGKCPTFALHPQLFKTVLP